MINKTFLLFVFNEERRIRDIVQNVRGHGEIIVVDNHSTDSTVSIAGELGLKVISIKNPGFIENQDALGAAIKFVNTEWVYILYADEMIPLALLNRIQKIIDSDKYDVIKVYRKNFMLGREVFNYDFRPTLRAFKKGAVDFSGNIIHEMGKLTVPTSRVTVVERQPNLSIWHLGHYNIGRLESAHNRYGDIEASMRFYVRGEKFSITKLVGRPILYFLGTYIAFGGFRTGVLGLLVSVEIAHLKFSILAKMWEMENRVSLDEITARYSGMKKVILDDIKKGV
jgi:glycosyltransferase involved in cell wall biosynthesis